MHLPQLFCYGLQGTNNQGRGSETLVLGLEVAIGGSGSERVRMGGGRRLLTGEIPNREDGEREGIFLRAALAVGWMGVGKAVLETRNSERWQQGKLEREQVRAWRE